MVLFGYGPPYRLGLKDAASQNPSCGFGMRGFVPQLPFFSKYRACFGIFEFFNLNQWVVKFGKIRRIDLDLGHFVT
jgi:hypothetical protein